MKLHPYALILGLGLGFFVLLTLRYLPFAILVAIIGVLGFDLAFKARAKKVENKDTDKKDEEE